MADFWKDEPGENIKRSWFKQHPMATLGILAGCVVIITVVTVL